MIPAIEIENISKSYTINHEQKASSGNATFRDALYGVAQKPLELFTGKKLQKEEFRALDNISFEVMPGEVMGIVGRNGSGKSTLLKILSRIAEPTSGRVTMRGKVASLLEVGTGFHPELTGRENVFFNGAILGMSRKEIKDKFNDIVEFSEVEKFLDTPVKFYSSGMYVRLAFAVAAHLDTDILIVDEVLAVGDAAFQKKCIGKMNSVARDGRTVLFVSHNANAIQQLCSRAVYLDGGKMVSIGDTDSVLKEYFTSQNLTSGTSSWENKGKYKHDNFTPLSFRLCDSTGEIIDKAVGNDDDVFVEISGDIKKPDELLTVGYALYAEDGECIYWSYATDGEKTSWPKIKTGKNIMRSALPKRLLNEGNYRLELIASLHFKEWILEPGVTSPSINLDIKSGFSPSPYYLTRRPSILAPILEWEVQND